MIDRNPIQRARDQVAELIQAAYKQGAAQGLLPQGVEAQATVELPKDPTHGDYASSYALATAKAMKLPPRELAQRLIQTLQLEGSYFQKVEVAGPGFLNFTLGSNWYLQVLKTIEELGEDYGRSQYGEGQRVMVEFVSANPTGPMHMGNARGGVLGDTLANVLERTGYEVWKEFYVNDAGNQIHKFALSLQARYLQQLLGEEAIPFPEDGYQGEDIKELAQSLVQEVGDSWKDLPQEELFAKLADYGLSINIPKMKGDLEQYGISYHQWFYESSLYASGYVEETMELLTQRGYTYEKEGALWLRTTQLLREKWLREGKSEKQVENMEQKDDVLRRANGYYTYFAADIAYHRNKLEVRGFDRAINIWGADHHGHVARLQAALDGLGLEGSRRLVVVLMQLVNLMQDGVPVRMSKRSGKMITLHDLLDEIQVDAARYFFNSRSATTALDFDLDLAVRQDGENPVYYVQYAHARICSLLQRLEGEGYKVPQADQLEEGRLSAPEEMTLIKGLAQYPEELSLAAQEYDPSRINRYLVLLAGDFHRFYNACRIQQEEKALLLARLKLADTVRLVLQNGLKLLGVSAPQKM